MHTSASRPPSGNSRANAVGAALLVAGLSLGSAACGATTPGEITLVGRKSTWRAARAPEGDPAIWRDAAFDDRGWTEIQAPYVAPTGGVGPEPGAAGATVVFRRRFRVEHPERLIAARLRLLRDDGAVVWLNGREIVRSNLRRADPVPSTPALYEVRKGTERRWYEFAVSPKELKAGENVLVVQVHQTGPKSPDVRFGLALVGWAAGAPCSVTRGPYLQRATPASVTVRWRTNVPCRSRVRFGTSATTLDRVADGDAATTEHKVIVRGLTPDHPYWYALADGERTVAGDASFTFRTPPSPGSARPTRIWVLGDPGTADHRSAAVYKAYRDYAGAHRTDVWITVGDNAYPRGSEDQLDAAIFETYPELLRTTPFWPALGNHDLKTGDPARERTPYYAAFNLPENAESGGLPSGTERYYAFDFANIHFVALDTSTKLPQAGDPMLGWLARDLAATRQEWIIVYMHHPPYTRGSYDSDTAAASIAVRTAIVPIVEAAGVDLVLAGHSHAYERSLLLHGHLGPAASIRPENIVDGGEGDPSTGTPYHKDRRGRGTVYVVSGSAGQQKGNPRHDHPAIVRSAADFGSVVIDVDGCRLDARFLSAKQLILDRFAIEKPAPCGAPAATKEDTP